MANEKEWRPALRAAMDHAGEDFAGNLRKLGAAKRPAAWAHADTPELAGLERWGTTLAKSDRVTGIAALVVAAQYGFSIAGAAGKDELADLGFFGKEGDPIVDGASVEVQIARSGAWLDAPGKPTKALVGEAFDPSRQLQVWDEDLHPTEDTAFYWYLDVGQCCCAAIVATKGKASGDTYYEWPAETCVGRGLVLVARGLLSAGADVDEVFAGLRRALVA
jgi:hypothetical protein